MKLPPVKVAAAKGLPYGPSASRVQRYTTLMGQLSGSSTSSPARRPRRHGGTQAKGFGSKEGDHLFCRKATGHRQQGGKRDRVAAEVREHLSPLEGRLRAGNRFCPGRQLDEESGRGW